MSLLLAHRVAQRCCDFTSALETEPEMSGCAGSASSVANDPIVALLREFGAVRQMPRVVKRARCTAAGLPARPTHGKAATTITSTSIPGRQKSVVRQARAGGSAGSTH